MIDRNELKRKLPGGYQKEIAQRAGVSLAAVSRYLNNKNNNNKVEIAVLELLAELSDKKKELLNRIV